MSRKLLKIAFTVIVIIVAFFSFRYYKYIYGRMGFRRNTDTPKEFVNYAGKRSEDYTKDSLELIRQFRKFIVKREGFFNDRSYFDSTEIIIDSILYSPDLDKLAAFIIVKNPTYRQTVPDKRRKWYYDATCYLGVIKNDTIKLSWIGPSFTNSNNKAELSGILRQSYFTEFATADTVGPYTYKYNLDDVRFWTSSIWEEIKEKEMKKQQFEEEKKKHPENIYEPKR